MDDNECTKKLTFLFSSSFMSLPESYVKLRSILNLHFFNISKIFNLKLPKYFISKNLSCPYCYNQWTHNFKSIKLLSSTGKKFKKLNTNKNTLVEDSATNNISKEVSCTKNKLILKCQVCTKTCKFLLEKPINAKKKKKNQKADLVLKKIKKNKTQNFSEGKLMVDNWKIKKKQLNKKRLLSPNSNTVTVSKLIMYNKNFLLNKNKSLTKFEPKEAYEKREPVLHLNVKKQLYEDPINNTAIKKKTQFIRLKRAMKNEANISKNSLKNLLTIINKE